MNWFSDNLKLTIFEKIYIKFALCFIILYNIVYQHNKYDSNVLNNIIIGCYSILYNIVLSIINALFRVLHIDFKLPFFDKEQHYIVTLNLYIFIHICLLSMILYYTIPQFKLKYIIKLTIEYIFILSLLQFIS